MRTLGILSLILLFLLPTLVARGDGLEGKVMCGYQGWFRTPEDGSRAGWQHYSNKRTFEPGQCTIDLWPDVREYPPSARVATPFKHPDGSVAEVYSSVNPEVISKHFEWMKSYGIDGVFIQRFAVSARDPRSRQSMDDILTSCRKASTANGRCWSLMYDLSGLKPGEIEVVITDWKRLQEQYKLAEDTACLRVRGKPLVALWGLGFSDRPAMLDEWRRLVRFFKEEAGCTVMLGVPTYWRTLQRDAIADAALHDILKMADVVSPWTIGRYRTQADVARHVEGTVNDDLRWCREQKLDYLPVAFPGFSWHNLMASRGKAAPVNDIPRQGGRFLWSQARQFQAAGAKSLYVAMFDELDEGTAIFKTRNDPPEGASQFASEKDVPPDRYLEIVGKAGALFRGQPVKDLDGLPEGIDASH